MRLYEIDIISLWWIAAEDASEAMIVLRDELSNSEISEEEIDIAMDDLTINELCQEEAETIAIEDECGSLESLWSVFALMFDAGLVHSDYLRDDDFEEEEVNYNEEGSLPEDWV